MSHFTCSLAASVTNILCFVCLSSRATLRCFSRRRLSGLPQAGCGWRRAPERGSRPAHLRPVPHPLPPGWHPAVHRAQTEAVPRQPLLGQTSGQAAILAACLTPLHVLVSLSKPAAAAPTESASPSGGGHTGVVSGRGLLICALARNNPQAGECHR